jgi:CheY-like chemotaxis protein
MTLNQAGTDHERPVVLLIDDDEAFRYAIARQLEATGIVVLPAADYRDALPILDGTQTVDLMLTDIVLPGGPHGFALAQMAILRRRGLPVMYITGHAELMRNQPYSVLGKVICKPVEADVLAAEIRSALAA